MCDYKHLTNRHRLTKEDLAPLNQTALAVPAWKVIVGYCWLSHMAWAKSV